MRTAPLIQEIWQRGGPFIGAEGKPQTRLTVQDPWDFLPLDHEHDFLIATLVGTGNYIGRGIPLRYFQTIDGSQTEREIPNVTNVHSDWSVDTDAGSCTFKVANQWMDVKGVGTAGQVELGHPGYFTPTRGQSNEAAIRWGQTANSWANTLVPNAVIRMYMGFGGQDKTIPNAVGEGNLIQRGMWLVDSVDIGTDGTITAKCRDMMKLLIEQQVYPPLIPSSRYPLKYYRWKYDNNKVNAANRVVSTTTTTGGNVTPGDKRTVFVGSEVDAWYPQGATGSEIQNGGYLLHGHRGIDSVDGNPDSFWLSVGNAHSDDPWATVWIEYDCSEVINAVYVNPWQGDYLMYVSVLEDGAWQGVDTVPYDPTYLFTSQPYAVDTGAGVPFVGNYNVPWETAGEYVLPRAYNAQRVRLSFRNLSDTPWGPWTFRAGLREVVLRGSASGPSSSGSGTVTTTAEIPPTFYAADYVNNPALPNSRGYITADTFGQIDAFGDSRIRPASGGDGPCNHEILSLTLRPQNDGYWVMCDHGHITAYGAAGFYGSAYAQRSQLIIPNASGPEGNKAGTIISTYTGNGYWVVGWDGIIYAFGDAPTHFGFAPPAGEFFHGAASHNAGYGIWAVATNGTVQVRGAAVHYGNWTGAISNTTQVEIATDVDSTDTNNGYLILSSGGHVQAFGDAVKLGDPVITVPSLASADRYYQIMDIPDDSGYLLIQGDGSIIVEGGRQTDFFGSPIPGGIATIRSDGNYLDYVDIIRDLVLWSGWLLYDEGLPSTSSPAVFGNLESTGSYSDEALPDTAFDKKPVIDAIHQIKEAVGYQIWADGQGGIHFESPNWWAMGNFNESGEHAQFLPEIDESHNLTQYTVNMSDENLRSLIIISSDDPEANLTSTVTTQIQPKTARNLRGLVKAAMWVNGFFQKKPEQRITAELIALHIWFSQRLGQVGCVANPCIEVNDQVRIYERITGESFIHYVRGMAYDHDIESGQFTMTLTTNWLGDGNSWAVTSDLRYSDNPSYFVISPELLAQLKQGGIISGNDGGTTSPGNPGQSGNPGIGGPVTQPPPITIGGVPLGTGGQGPTSSIKERLGFSPGAMQVTESNGNMLADTALASTLGAKWMRLDAFDNGNTNLDDAVDAAIAAGMSVLVIINSGGSSDVSYVATCNAVVTRYLARGVRAFELGNEPNNPTGFGGISLTATQYSSRVKAAYAAIKAIDPSVVVVAGGLSPGTGSNDPVTWVNTMYTQGCKGYFDVLSVHPYCYPYLPNQTASWSTWTKMVQIHGVMLAQADNKPIWATEFGVPTNASSEAFQSQSLTSAITEMASLPWLAQLFWYSIRDSGTSGSDDQQNFGLVKNGGTHKTAYAVYVAL